MLLQLIKILLAIILGLLGVATFVGGIRSLLYPKIVYKSYSKLLEAKQSRHQLASNMIKAMKEYLISYRIMIDVLSTFFLSFVFWVSLYFFIKNRNIINVIIFNSLPIIVFY